MAIDIEEQIVHGPLFRRKILVEQQKIQKGDFVKLVPNMLSDSIVYEVIDIQDNFVVILVDNQPVNLSKSFIALVYRKIEDIK
jgi:hypothetical protein